MLNKILKYLKIKFQGELKLKDGTPLIIDVEDLDVGASIMVQTPDGKLVDLPNGQYELENSSIITVENGLVTDIVDQIVQTPEPDPIENSPWRHAPHPHPGYDATEMNKEEINTELAYEPILTPQVADNTSSDTLTGSTTGEVKKQLITMNPEIQKIIDELMAKFADLESRIAALEGGNKTDKPVPADPTASATSPDTTKMSAETEPEIKVENTMAIEFENMKKDLSTLMNKATFVKEVTKREVEDTTKDSRLEYLKNYRNK